MNNPVTIWDGKKSPEQCSQFLQKLSEKEFRCVFVAGWDENGEINIYCTTDEHGVGIVKYRLNEFWENYNKGEAKIEDINGK